MLRHNAEECTLATSLLKNHLPRLGNSKTLSLWAARDLGASKAEPAFGPAPPGQPYQALLLGVGVVGGHDPRKNTPARRGATWSEVPLWSGPRDAEKSRQTISLDPLGLGTPGD